jgi:hypothetical protein
MILVTLLLFGTAALLRPSGSERAAEERLSFQTSGPWSPRTNLNADVAMVYGIGLRMPANIETSRYDISGGMLRIRFPNSVEPVQVEVRLAK